MSTIRGRLLLDCDGVMCDLMSAWLLELGLRGYEATEYSLACTELPRSRRLAALNVVSKRAKWMRPYPGVRDHLAELRETWDVHCVSAMLRRGRYKWLRGMGFEEHQIHLTRNKALISGDAFVDDDSSQVRAWSLSNVGKMALLMQHPYNRKGSYGLRKISSLAEVNQEWERHNGR